MRHILFSTDIIFLVIFLAEIEDVTCLNYDRRRRFEELVVLDRPVCAAHSINEHWQRRRRADSELFDQLDRVRTRVRHRQRRLGEFNAPNKVAHVEPRIFDKIQRRRCATLGSTVLAARVESRALRRDHQERDLGERWLQKLARHFHAH